MGKIDQMSREEVLAEISRMKQQYPQLMDISPTFTIEAKKNEPTQARTKTLGQIIQEDQPLSGLDED
jgi:ABC-type enterochelin transport system substrate-binding protein